MLTIMKKIISFIILCFLLKISFAQDFSAYQKKEFIQGGDTLRYRILYPEKYNPNKKYPVIIFLHGSGERGYDNEKQLTHGGSFFLESKERKKNKVIVILPQCPPNNVWSTMKRRKDTTSYGLEIEFLINEKPTVPEYLVKLLADSLVNAGKANPKRLYIGGLSLGGFGTYDLINRYPGFFAAAFPICGLYDIDLFMKNASTTPIWIFHGALDKVVSPNPDRELIKRLKAAGAKDAAYTEFPLAEHNSWDSTFAHPGVLKWVFKHSKP